MSPETFVTKLADTAPSEGDLERLGMSGKEAEDFRKYYFCVRREKLLDCPKGTDNVLNLLRNWDLADVEVGMVRFPDVPAEQPGKIHVGYVEADPLLLLIESGELVVHEFGTEGHLLWRVAMNGSRFLEALVIAAQFLARRVAGKVAYDDYDTARLAALECATAAGGDSYADFYTMLLGGAA